MSSYRGGVIVIESQAWKIPSKIMANKPQREFTSISSQTRPAHSIHCRGVIHTKCARPRLWNAHQHMLYLFALHFAEDRVTFLSPVLHDIALILNKKCCVTTRL